MVKHYAYVIAALLCVSFSGAASARNFAIENALRSQPDLSSFYQGLINTGILVELSPNSSYTVFAPTNEAFLQVAPAEYPCFYSIECKREVAAILRNHIIPGSIYVDDAIKHREGGVFSIGRRFVNIGEMGRGHYAIDGHDIVYASAIDGGFLYKINGVIVNPQELAMTQGSDYGEPRVVTTTTKRSISMPVCSVPGGCIDSVTETTTITRPARPARW